MFTNDMQMRQGWVTKQEKERKKEGKKRKLRKSRKDRSAEGNKGWQPKRNTIHVSYVPPNKDRDLSQYQFKNFYNNLGRGVL